MRLELPSVLACLRWRGTNMMPLGWRPVLLTVLGITVRVKLISKRNRQGGRWLWVWELVWDGLLVAVVEGCWWERESWLRGPLVEGLVMLGESDLATGSFMLLKCFLRRSRSGGFGACVDRGRGSRHQLGNVDIRAIHFLLGETGETGGTRLGCREVLITKRRLSCRTRGRGGRGYKDVGPRAPTRPMGSDDGIALGGLTVPRRARSGVRPGTSG